MEYGVRKPTTIGTPQGGVVSPLLANIVLNHLDWQLHHAGFAFVRYADDFVVVCPSTSRAEEARAFVESVLDKLGLKLSPSKTKIVSYGIGYSFLGFVISPRSRRMRPKSVKKFKDKVRELTRRKHNFEAEVIVKLNRVIGGPARYFATSFFTGQSSFHKLDSWDSHAAPLHEIQEKIAQLMHSSVIINAILFTADLIYVGQSLLLILWTPAGAQIPLHHRRAKPLRAPVDDEIKLYCSAGVRNRVRHPLPDADSYLPAAFQIQNRIPHASRAKSR